MATNIPSQGSTLTYKAAGASSHVGIGNLTTFTIRDGSASEIDVTNLSSTSKEFILGLSDAGSCSFDINYDPNEAGHKLLDAAYANGKVGEFKLILSTGTLKTYTFQAFVMGFSITGGVDAVNTASVSIRITGGVTIS